MSQDRPPARPEDSPNPQQAGSDDQGTIIGRFRPEQETTTGAVGVQELALCRVCQQPLEPDSRFCQACGAQVDASAEPGDLAPVDEGRPRWGWYIVAGAWLILSAVALYFLYSGAFLLGTR